MSGDESEDEERERLTSHRDRMADLAARLVEAQAKADEAHSDAKAALRRFEDGLLPPDEPDSLATAVDSD